MTLPDRPGARLLAVSLTVSAVIVLGAGAFTILAALWGQR